MSRAVVLLVDGLTAWGPGVMPTDEASAWSTPSRCARSSPRSVRRARRCRSSNPRDFSAGLRGARVSRRCWASLSRRPTARRRRSTLTTTKSRLVAALRTERLPAMRHRAGRKRPSFAIANRAPARRTCSSRRSPVRSRSAREPSTPDARWRADCAASVMGEGARGRSRTAHSRHPSLVITRPTT